MALKLSYLFYITLKLDIYFKFSSNSVSGYQKSPMKLGAFDWGGIAKDVRTLFEKKGNKMVYIPSLV